MSNVLIKDDPAAELERLRATNFFRDKPADQTESGYLHSVAQREAQRFGVYDHLANHYIRISTYARKVGA